MGDTMRSIFNWLLRLAGGLVVLVLIVWCVWACLGWRHEDTAYIRGQNAYRAGVSAEGNPYLHGSSTHAPLWLDGWIDAKEEHEAAEHKRLEKVGRQVREAVEAMKQEKPER